MAWRRDVTTHRYSLLHAIERRNLGPVPPILAGGDPWLPPESRQAMDEAVTRDFAEQGLAIGGELTDDLLDALHVLAHPELGYYGWIQSHDAGSYAAGVYRIGRDCILLTRRGDLARLAAANPDTMVDKLIAQTPMFDAAQGESISIRESEAPWQADLDDPYDDVNQECRRLDHVLNLARYGGGQLHGVTKTGPGHGQLTYLDTVEGRWLLARTSEGADEPWIVATPATPQAFALKLTQLT